MRTSILKELEELTHSGIITTETAARIEDHLRQKKESQPNPFTIVLGLLGVLLVSLGIILFIAHNWDQFNRVSKTILAFIPLLLGQALCFFTLQKKKGQLLWQEGSASFLVFGIGACIALISQVYQVSGSMSEFLLTWLLLSAPLIYVMPSSVASLLFIAGCTWYACESGYSGIIGRRYTSEPYLYLPLMLVVLPHYYKYVTQKRQSNFFHLYNWFIVASLTISLGMLVNRNYSFSQGPWIAYLLLFGIFYLAGRYTFLAENNILANPFLVTGLLGILIIYFTWSFDWTWREANFRKPVFPFGHSFDYVILVLFLIHLGIGWYSWKQHKSQVTRDPSAFSPWIFILCVLLLTLHANTGQFIMNLSLLVTGIYYIRQGSLKNHLGVLNAGLLIIAILALVRFFDDSIPFVWRGIFFLVAGAGFFAANYLLLKRRKELSNTKSTE